MVSVTDTLSGGEYILTTTINNTGGYMPSGKSLIDVLEEEYNGATGEFLEICQSKFIGLKKLILSTEVWKDPNEPRCPTDVNDKGEKIPCISHPDLTWAKDRIALCLDKVKPTKQELNKANSLWRKYANYR